MDVDKLVEISDLIVRFDPEAGRRVPVDRAAVVERFRALGNRWAARVVSRLPVLDDGQLDPHAVDRELVAAHRELQRLNEEFQQAERLARVVRPLVSLVDGPRRVVDVGCGVGYASRWLARNAGLEETALIGCDFNPALIAEARRAAALDEVDATFLVQDAFRLETPGHVFTSTGVVHHFSRDELAGFFAAHARSPELVGFCHFDIEAHWLSPIGSALFHLARMRVPLAQHDGIWSARRAHPARVLVEAAREGLPGFTVGIFDRHKGPLPITRVLRPVLGVRADLADRLRDALGPLANRWETT